MAEEYSEEESDEEIREVFGLIEEMKTFVEYDVRDQYTQRVFLEEADEELTKRECNYDIIELLVSDFKTLAKEEIDMQRDEIDFPNWDEKEDEVNRLKVRSDELKRYADDIVEDFCDENYKPLLKKQKVTYFFFFLFDFNNPSQRGNDNKDGYEKYDEESHKIDEKEIKEMNEEAAEQKHFSGWIGSPAYHSWKKSLDCPVSMKLK